MQRFRLVPVFVFKKKKLVNFKSHSRIHPPFSKYQIKRRKLYNVKGKKKIASGLGKTKLRQVNLQFAIKI